MAAQGWKAFQTYLEMIKFEHSIFALPFAMVGMMLASVSHRESPWPGWRIFLLILVCMVSARSAAMAYNRIKDRDIDSKNPRTKSRAIPAGLLKLSQVNVFFLASCIVFFASAAFLNQLTLILSPIALAVILFYSHTKRFTWTCHFWLGLSLGVAPAAAWIAVTGSLSPVILPLVAGVALWTGGFDIIYSLQDEEFDQAEGLHSLPEKFGRARALTISRVCHVLAILSFGWLIYLAGLGAIAWVGLALTAGLLIYEQSLVKPSDLSRVNMAFFTLNGFVSILFFAFVWLELAL